MPRPLRPLRGAYAPAERPTFSCVSPANCPGPPYVAFNSYVNAPNYGDERAFVDAKKLLITEPGGFSDHVVVHEDDRVLLRVYVHNNAGVGTGGSPARETELQLLLDAAEGRDMLASASITASNALPQTVSDTVRLTSARAVRIRFDRDEPVYLTYRPNGRGAFVTRELPGATFANHQTLNVSAGDWRASFGFAALITAVVAVERP